MIRKLQLCTNVRIGFRCILLVAALLFSSVQSYAQLGQTDLDEIKEQLPFFKNRYTKNMVWDCSRSPSDAKAGEEWTLSSFGAPYDATTSRHIDFGVDEDRYVQFDIDYMKQEDTNFSLTDDFGNKLVISLKLYDANGNQLSILSTYGTIQGLGTEAPGLFYEQEGFYGTLFTMENYNEGGSITYIPETGVVEALSELGLVSSNGSIKTDNDKGLIIETSNKYKEGENDPTKSFDGTISAGEIENLTIGTSATSTIDILIKETTVKTSGGTTVTPTTTATLTLSGANDLGVVENNGVLTFEKESGTAPTLGENTAITNKGEFRDYAGLLSKVEGDAPITVESTDVMNKQFTIEKGSSKVIVAEASTDNNNAILSYQWQKQNESSDWEDIPSLRSTTPSGSKMIFKEAGQYRCLMSSTNGNIVSVLTAYVTIKVTTPAPPPYIPSFYSVSLPEVEGVSLSRNAGNHAVEEWTNFSFALTLTPGYEQSVPIVKANGSVIELNYSGLYVIRNVHEDMIVTIDGVVKNTPPTAIDKIDGRGAKVWGANETLHVYTPQAGDIQIINFAGKRIRQKRKACGESHFDLPKGAYIVLVGNESFKIVL